MFFPLCFSFSKCFTSLPIVNYNLWKIHGQEALFCPVSGSFLSRFSSVSGSSLLFSVKNASIWSTSTPVNQKPAREIKSTPAFITEITSLSNPKAFLNRLVFAEHQDCVIPIQNGLRRYCNVCLPFFSCCQNINSILFPDKSPGRLRFLREIFPVHPVLPGIQPILHRVPSKDTPFPASPENRFRLSQSVP